MIKKIIISALFLLPVFTVSAQYIQKVPQGGTGAATLTGCLEGNGIAPITGSGLPCGSGSGSGSNSKWATGTPANYITPNTAGVGLIVSASSTISALTVTNGTTTNATSTNLYSTKIGVNSEYFTDLTGTGLQNTGGALTLNATGDWTGTFDGQEGSYYLDRTNHTGTQGANTITNGVFGSGIFDMETLNVTGANGLTSPGDMIIAANSGGGKITFNSNQVVVPDGNASTQGLLIGASGVGIFGTANTLNIGSGGATNFKIVTSGNDANVTIGDAGGTGTLTITNLTDGCLQSVTGVVTSTGSACSFSKWTDEGSYLRPTNGEGILVNASSTIGNGLNGGGLSIYGTATTTGTTTLAVTRGVVAIATSTPTSTGMKLDVYGNLRVGSAGRVTDNLLFVKTEGVSGQSQGAIGFGTSSPTSFVTFSNVLNSSQVGFDFWNADGRGGGVGADNNSLNFFGPDGSSIVFLINNSKIRMQAGKNIEMNTGDISFTGNGSGLQFDTGNFACASANTCTPLSAMSVEGGMSVGTYGDNTAPPLNGLIVSHAIGSGTTSPWAQLSIATSTNPIVPFFAISSTTGTITNTIFIVDQMGDVGVGTTTPYAKLSVVGEIVARNLTATSTTATSTFGGPISLQSAGTGPIVGNATLVAGTVTVTTAAVNTNSYVQLTRKTSGGTIGTAITYTLAAGSFSINSDNPLDTSTFTWTVWNP